MKKNRFLPFWILPASWGLKGTVRDEAEAYYTLDGEDLDRRLAKIHHEGEELARRNLDLDLKYNKINQYNYDLIVARRDAGAKEVDQKVAALGVDLKHGKITQTEFEKEEATLREKPWIKVVNDGFDESEGLSGFFFEFDWNQQFIAYLQLNGYSGATEEDIVEQWFQDVCRTQVQESDEFVIQMGGRFM